MRRAIGVEPMSNDNVVSVLSRGNQELFHSAMLAWLMDERGSHGLGRSFLDGALARLGLEARGDLDVVTEHRGKHGRYDILLRERDTGDESIIFENKTKALGTHSQAARYASDGATVALLALLPEMFDEASRANWSLLSYRSVHDVLAELELDPGNGYQFVVSQYRDYLDALLRPFEILREAGDGTQALDHAALDEMRSALTYLGYRNNDWRTLIYYYYVTFRAYAQKRAPDLVFGTKGYRDAAEAGENMLWQPEKNRQGPPFLEAVLHAPDRLGTSWTLHPDVASHLHSSDGITPLIPRLELWGLDRIAGEETQPNTQIGWWALGIYGGVPGPLWTFLTNNDTYSSGLNGTRRRNFHVVPVSYEDLAFDRMADRLRELLAFLYDRDGESAGVAT